uniref:hypothetical protein n=1 Tax=Promicromonospora sp. CA-289581 TaxID=3240013 RepID=UPI003F4992B6
MDYDFGIFVQSAFVPPVTQADQAYVEAVRRADALLEEAVAARAHARDLWQGTTWATRQSAVAPRCAAGDCVNLAEHRAVMCAEHRCKGTRADGRPCRGWAMYRQTMCAAHLSDATFKDPAAVAGQRTP